MQPETLFSRMCATDIWATDACKVWGKYRMRATYIPDARNPINRQRAERIQDLLVSALPVAWDVQDNLVCSFLDSARHKSVEK